MKRSCIVSGRFSTSKHAINNGVTSTTPNKIAHAPPPPAYEPMKVSPKPKESMLGHFTLHHFVHSFYIPMLQKAVTKVNAMRKRSKQFRSFQTMILVISAVMLSAGIYGLQNLEDGLELSDVMAKGTAAHDFLLAREK